MSYYPLPKPVPVELLAEQFTLRPLCAAVADLDYEAMLDRWATRQYLAEGGVFTPQSNREAIREHEQDHRERRAFTYSVLTPSAQPPACLGCVYIESASELLSAGGADHSQTSESDAVAAARFWVRDSGLAAGVDQWLFAALRVWLATVWEIAGVVWHTDARDRRQARLFRDAGLRLWLSLDMSYGAFYRAPTGESASLP